jgi:hypothetical protein
MANFKEAIEKVYKLEFSNPKNALHKNKTENKLTFMGIYEKYYPNLSFWGNAHLLLKNKDIKEVSELLYDDDEVKKEVNKFYKKHFWDRLRLDEVKEQRKAEMILIFAVNVGVKTASKILQETLNVTVDGIVGKVTIKVLNDFVFDKFECDFKLNQIRYYIDVTKKNPTFLTYLNGWYNRVIRS